MAGLLGGWDIAPNGADQCIGLRVVQIMTATTATTTTGGPCIWFRNEDSD